MRAAGLAALAGLLLLDGAGSPALAGEGLGWTRYRNARFAVSVEYRPACSPTRSSRQRGRHPV